MRTTVKWFNVAKGYGFLENGTGPDIYVNAKSLRGAERVNTGDMVEFECHVFDGKLVARHVKPVRSSQTNSGGQHNNYGNSSHGNQNGHGSGNRYGSGNDGNRQEFYPRSQQPRFVMQ